MVTITRQESLCSVIIGSPGWEGKRDLYDIFSTLGGGRFVMRISGPLRAYNPGPVVLFCLAGTEPPRLMLASGEANTWKGTLVARLRAVLEDVGLA